MYSHSIVIYISHWTTDTVCTDGDVRLAGSDRNNQGRVEICFNNQYGTVCDDGWDNVDASVVCGQLGFQRAG